ncbi:MAG: sulfotransferase [Actinomycetota bacterium]
MSRDASPLVGRLIFVVGARRSGTNWLQRIVGAHPAVASIPSETYLFSHGFPPLVERFHHSALGSGQTGFVYMDRDAMLDGLRDFADSVFEGMRAGLDPGAERIVERTPDHVRHLALMGEVYPDGRFLHIVRDGRDVARSLRSQPWGPSSIAEAAEEWRSAIEAARSAAPQLEHYLEVRYEDLLADPRSGIRTVLDWLGLASDDETVSQTLIEARVRFNVDPQAPAVVEGKWRNEFSAQDVSEFDRIGGAVLTALGYGASSTAAATTVDPAPVAPDEPSAKPASLRRRVKRKGRSLLRALGRRSAGRVRRELRPRQREMQIVVDRFLATVGGQDWAGVRGMMTDSAHVRIVAVGKTWQGRGAVGAERLVEFLAADTALRGRQVWGDVHPGLPTFTVVVAYRLDDGSEAHRVWTLTVEGERIGRVAYYGLAASSGAPADLVTT